MDAIRDLWQLIRVIEAGNRPSPEEVQMKVGGCMTLLNHTHCRDQGGACSVLCSMIRSAHSEVRAAIASTLPHAVDGLMPCLRNSDAVYFLLAIAGSSNAEIGEPLATLLPSVVDSLVMCLGSRDAKVRNYATETLGAIADSPIASVRAAYAALLPGLVDRQQEDVTVKRAAAAALAAFSGKPEAGIGPALVSVVQDLTVFMLDASVQVRSNAASALGAIAGSSHAVAGSALASVLPRAVDGLLLCLERGYEAVRRCAAGALVAIAGSPHAEIGAALATVLPRVVEGLMLCFEEDCNTEVRSYAAGALGAIARSSISSVKAAYAALLPGLVYRQQEDTAVKCAAAAALAAFSGQPEAEIEPALVGVIENLRKCLSDASVQVRSNAADALGAIASTPHATAGAALAKKLPLVVEVLLRCVEDTDEAVRRCACRALAAIAGSPPIASYQPRGMAAPFATVLPDVVDGLVMYLESRDAESKICAAGALGAIASSQISCVRAAYAALLPSLVHRQQEEHSSKCGAATVALVAFSGQPEAEIEPALVGVIESLMPLISDASAQVRCNAATALASIASSSHAVVGSALAHKLSLAVDGLLLCLEDSNASSRRCAAGALLAIDGCQRPGMLAFQIFATKS